MNSRRDQAWTNAARSLARARFRRLAVEQFEPRTLLAITPLVSSSDGSPFPHLLADINQTSAGISIGGQPVELNGPIYLLSNRRDANSQLVKTDGTPAGTSVVANLSLADNLVRAGNTLFFSAYDDVH